MQKQTFISSSIESAHPYLVVNVACLEKNAQKALDIISEIITKTVYDEDIAKTVLARELNNTRMKFMGNGVMLAMDTSESIISSAGYYSTLFGGYPFFTKLQEYNAAPITFCDNAKNILPKVFNNGNLCYRGLTGNKDLLAYELVLPNGKSLRVKHL